MRILIALNHPAHYYLFKFFTAILNDKGHNVIYVIKNKDILENLLIRESAPYIKISEKKKVNSALSIISKGGVELIQRDIRLFNVVRGFKPDIMLGTDISITHIGKIMGIPSLVFNEDDYDINKIFCKFSYPFATNILAPEYCNVGKYSYKKIGYNGIQKMAYLNRKYFTPNLSILLQHGIKRNEKYFIIRLVSLTAGHDIEGKHKGLNKNILYKIIARLEKFGRIYITSEDKLDNSLEKYKLNVPINEVHSLMAYASLFIGDSQTMCAEAGILGTPFIRFNDFVGKISYLNDLEKNYRLGFGVKTNEIEKLFLKIDELTKVKNLKKEWAIRREKLFLDKIDVTAFMVWFVENYPASAKIMKENPDYQYNFK